MNCTHIHSDIFFLLIKLLCIQDINLWMYICIKSIFKWLYMNTVIETLVVLSETDKGIFLILKFK